MLQEHQIEELVALVSSMDRAALRGQFLGFQGRFKVDFTPEFLDQLSTDRMRHIYVALCLQTQHIPSSFEAAVA